MHSFFANHKIVHVEPNAGSAGTWALSAGTSDVKSVGVDRTGFEGIAWLPTFGDNVDTGTFTATLQHSDTDVDGNYANALDEDGNAITVSFTAGASDTDGEQLGLEAYGTKLKKYVRLSFDRGTANTVIADLKAILFKPTYAPVTQPTGTGQFIAQPTVKHVVS